MFNSRHMTQASFQKDQDPEPQSKKRKRHRETLSCLQCRARKVSCNRERPCSSCVRHKRVEDCVYAADDGLSAPIPPPQRQEAMRGGGGKSPDTVEERISQIERALSGSAPSATQILTHTPPQSRRSVDETQPRPSCIPKALPPQNNVLSRGRLARKPNGLAYYIGPSAWTICVPFNVFNDVQLSSKLQNRWKKLIDITASFGVKAHDTILNFTALDSSTSLLDNIPGDNECRILANRFLGSVNILTPMVDRMVFEEELHAFLLDREAVSRPWLALLVSILALGYVTPILPLADGGYALKRDKAEQLASLARQHAFSASAISHRSPLATFQTLLALTMFKVLSFGWIDGNNGISGLLGLAQRLVFCLGLHRDPSMALQEMPEHETQIRRTVFVTYLRLEYMHSLETGMPFLFRTSDFDVNIDFRSGGSKQDHQADFMQMLPVISKVLQMTHTSRSGLPEHEIKDLLESLQLGSAAMQVSIYTELDSSQQLLVKMQTTINALCFHRTHVALLALLLEQSDHDLRSRLTSDMVTPALMILDSFNSLCEAIESKASAETIKGWQVLMMSTVRIPVYNATAYLLTFLQKSLVEPNLLALRGSTPAALDSSHIFRKIRMALKTARCTLDISVHCVKENVAYAAFLKSVEERYRMFVEKGVADVDLTSEEGRFVLDSFAETMDEMLDLASAAIQSSTDAPPQDDFGTSNFADLTSVDQFNMMENWDWPWDSLDGDSLWTTLESQPLNLS
ncbi:Transcription factor lepE-like protein [Elsinoe fawcettii]|nr:Transcription factor lepE-like protein [Elsinoe fawcettii]